MKPFEFWELCRTFKHLLPPILFPDEFVIVFWVLANWIDFHEQAWMKLCKENWHFSARAQTQNFGGFVHRKCLSVLCFSMSLILFWYALMVQQLIFWILTDKLFRRIKFFDGQKYEIFFYLKEWETIEKVAADGTVRRYRRRIVETVITTLNKKESGYQRSGYERNGANGLPVRMEEFDDSHPHNNIDPSVSMNRRFFINNAFFWPRQIFQR